MNPLPQVVMSDASLTIAGGACLLVASGLFGMLWLIARTACDGAHLMYIGDAPERLRTLVQIPEEQQRSDALRTPRRGHDLPESGAQVGGRGGQSIHDQGNDA